MNRTLIIEIIGSSENALYTGDVWGTGWNFNKEYMLVLRKNDADLTGYDNLSTDLSLQDTNIIIWINNTKPHEHETICGFIDSLVRKNPNNIFYFAYHTLALIGVIQSNIHMKAYSFGKANEKQFKKILLPEGYNFNKKATFDNIFACFFLNPPDVLAFIEHKLKGLFAPIDIDLQLLFEQDFREPYWSEIIDAHSKRGDIIKLARQYLYGEGSTLEQLVAESTGARKNRIEKVFSEIGELLPARDDSQLNEKCYAFWRILNGLSLTCVDCQNIIKPNIEGFRKWQRDLFDALEELRFLILEDKDPAK